MQALIVTPDGKSEHRNLGTDTLRPLQHLVGGYVERVFVTTGVYAYVNEDGLARNLPDNALGTLLAGRLGVDMLVGTVVFLGSNAAGTEDADLPPEWLNL